MGGGQENSSAKIRPVRLCLDPNVYDKLVGYNRELFFAAHEKGLVRPCGFGAEENEAASIPPKKLEKRRALIALLELLPDGAEPAPGAAGRDLSHLREWFGPKDAIRVASAQAARCDFFVTENADLRRAIRAIGLPVRPCGYGDLVHLLGILLYEKPPTYRYLADDELEYLYPMTYRHVPDKILRIHNQLPRVPGARGEHGIPVRDGEQLSLVLEEVNSDMVQGVHLTTDSYLALDGAKCGRRLTVFFDSEVAVEYEARPRSHRGSTTAFGGGRTEYSVECHTKEGMLWLWNVCAHYSQGVRIVRGKDMFSGMLVEELPDGYRYRCNDIQNDDDYDDLIFRVERRGSAGPRSNPSPAPVSRKAR